MNTCYNCGSNQLKQNRTPYGLTKPKTQQYIKCEQCGEKQCRLK